MLQPVEQEEPGLEQNLVDAGSWSEAVVLEPAKRPDSRTAVDVGAARGLTADEIVARERAWDAGQREKSQTFIAEMAAGGAHLESLTPLKTTLEDVFMSALAASNQPEV